MAQTEDIKKFQDLISECDQLIKSGNIAAVSVLLSKISLSQAPRSTRQYLAKICRRAGLISQGLKLLQPIIREVNSHIGLQATDGEICEYAVLLSRNGNLREAVELLEKIDTTKTPEALLYLGYCSISNWDYIKAAGFLEQFLKSHADPYSKLIAKVNLAASYIVLNRLKEAESLLSEIIQSAAHSGASRLAANCYQLRGQLHFLKDDFDSSRSDLKQAQVILGNVPSHDQLLIQKWQTFMKVIEEKSVQPLESFRENAWNQRHWESVREADFFAVKMKFDQKKFDHLYFGTPMPSYRQRIEEEVARSPSQTFLLGDEKGLCLDLDPGRLNHQTELGLGKKLHHVLSVLLLDLYVPRNLGSLFSELYPDEYFDIHSSPLRVRQLLFRTRQWLFEKQIPAEILQKRKFYRLAIKGSFGVRLHRNHQVTAPQFLHWEQLQKHFAGKISFSADEACRTMNWSRSTFLRWSNWAIKNGFIKKSGTNRDIRYHLEAHAA